VLFVSLMLTNKVGRDVVFACAPASHAQANATVCLSIYIYRKDLLCLEP